MNLARMNREQLLAEAARQGKVIDGDATREEIIAELRDPSVSDGAADGFVSPDKLSGKKVTIHIYAQEGPGGKDPVPVGLNGKVWLIPRDKDLKVPAELVGILKDSVQTFLIQDGKDEEGNIKHRLQDVRRFNYQATEDVARV
jgi:hypothetical protein